MSGSITKSIVAKGNKNSDIITTDDKVKAEKELTTEDKVRLGAAGLLMDFADEGEAFFESLFADDGDKSTFSERYAKNLKENQKALKDARGKEGSLKYEIGGAVIPGLLTLPLGGAGAAPTLAKGAGTVAKALFGTPTRKLATVGGVQGGITSVGSQDDANILDRVDDFGDLARFGKNVALGSGLSVAGGKAVEKGLQAITKVGTGKLLRKISDELGKPVEDELKRIATVSGLSIDDIILNIQKGQIIPEMDANIAKAVRGFVAQSSEGGAIVSDVARKRGKEKTKDVFETIQTDLAPNTALGNIKMFRDKSVEQLIDAESGAYNKIFKGADQQTANYENIGQSFLDLAKNRPELGKGINQFLEDAGLGRLTKEVTDDAGNTTLQLTRNVNLEVAENIKRALMDMKESAFSIGSATGKNRGQIFKNLEKGFQKQIDDISPELKKTRSNWASIMQGKDTFIEGEKAFGKSADDFELMLGSVMNKMQQTGDKTLLDTFKLGYVSSLRKKKGTASTKSFIRNLANEDTNVRQNLEKIYPDENIDTIIQKITNAEKSLMLLKQVDELSPTAKTLIDASKVGTREDLANLTQISTSLAATAQGLPNAGFIAPAKSLIAKYIKGSDGLSEDQMAQVARLLISENPDLIRSALTDVGARNQLIRNAQIIADSYISGGGSASAIVGTSRASGEGLPIIGTAFADDTEITATDTEDNKVIKDLSKTINKKTANKILGLNT